MDRRPCGLSFSVYRKPTNTGRYLHRDSSHPLSVFKGLVRTLATRAQRISSDDQLQTEKKNVMRSLRMSGFLDSECRKWWTPCRRRGNDDSIVRPKFQGSLPYVPCVSERIRGVLKSVGVNVALKPSRSLKSVLVRKRPDQPRVLGLVYHVPCPEPGCSWSYTGETGRTLEERKKEHARSVTSMDVQRSELARHVFESDHRVNLEQMSMVERETDWRRRVVKEAIWTKRHQSHNQTKHSLSAFWDVSKY